MQTRVQLQVLMNPAAGVRRWRCVFAGLRLLFVFLAVACFMGRAPVWADDKSPSQEQVKAACLFNLPKYVEWPDSVLPKADSPIVLAELGESDVGDNLREMVKGKVINGHPLVFKRISSDADIAPGTVHILFIGEAERRRIPEVLARIEGKNVLTVGEVDDFLDQGGMIYLGQRDRKIRMEINLTATKPARLVISSKLLSVAGAVRGKTN